MATNMFPEHAAQFKDALTNAGLWESGEQPDFDRVATKLEITAAYAQQMFEGKQRFSKPMREKLGLEIAFDDTKKSWERFKEDQKIDQPVMRDQNYYEAPYRVNQKSDGSYEIGEWKFVAMARTDTKEDAEKICAALNAY